MFRRSLPLVIAVLSLVSALPASARAYSVVAQCTFFGVLTPADELVGGFGGQLRGTSDEAVPVLSTITCSVHNAPAGTDSESATTTAPGGVAATAGTFLGWPSDADITVCVSGSVTFVPYHVVTLAETCVSPSGSTATVLA